MRGFKRLCLIGATGLGLSGCSSDPAFWDAVAQGLDQAAYDLANEPVCTWYTDSYGIVRQHCVPAYAVNQPVYVTPVYVAPDRDHGRHRDRDHGRRDRDDRRDRDHRRGPKG
ncbi:hypothetical protein [Brevundimonas sp. FT23028]|uniref:hypothetical protein n=1 Tax=Brevundimonas sp. FT23028 TaxID=3393748 RepID=UPI003B5869F3